MSDDPSVAGSSRRRAFLTGAAVSSAVVVGEVLRASPASAVNGDPILAGSTTTATSPTFLNGSTFVASNPGGAWGLTGEAAAIGVTGVSSTDTGIGVRAVNDQGGVALDVSGKAHFSRSGTKRVRAGKKRARVKLLGVSPTSRVFVTMQQHRSGFLIESAVPGTDQFVIWLNKPAPPGGLRAAWFVLD